MLEKPATPDMPCTPDIQQQLEQGFREAIARGVLDASTTMAPEEIDPAVRASQNPQFGDFQCNAALALAKRVGQNPRTVAAKIVEAAQSTVLGDLAEPLEIAGPGFINVRLKPAALAAQLMAMDDDALGVAPVHATHAVVVDLCGVNVAKQMHVGHLRATIIGDTLARVFERQGRTVHRENHLGDWGLPIAMTLFALRQRKLDLNRLSLEDLNRAYRDAQLTARNEERGLAAARAAHAGPHRLIEFEIQNAGAAEFERGAKEALVRLQSGDEELSREWRKIIDVTMLEVFTVAGLLNVNLGPQHTRGESFFRDQLGGVVNSFLKAGIAREDAGAIVVPFADRERPLLIRKSDGGFLYATTDLAALRYRVQELDGERVIYVVDARQRDHFKDVFDAAGLIGWTRLPDGVVSELVHIGFGAVLGPDKKPLKTRSGENFTLIALLEEAIARGQQEVARRASDPESATHALPPAELAAIGRAVGIAAIKYADLGTDVVRDYVFDLDRMIAFDGDTGPYLLYAHARISSIFARGNVSLESVRSADLLINEPAERQLALALLKYGTVVADVARTLEPHRLCAYLHTLAEQFSSFYNTCPVLKAEDPATRASRLRLCGLTRRVLKDGLELLGMTAPERM